MILGTPFLFLNACSEGRSALHPPPPLLKIKRWSL